MRLWQDVGPRCAYSRQGKSSIWPDGQATTKGAGNAVARNLPRPLQPGALHRISCQFWLYSKYPSSKIESVLQTGENYASCRELPEDTNIEIYRNRSLGNCEDISREDATRRFPNGNVNTFAVLVQTAPEGKTRRRIIVDERESGGNERQDVKERPVLPR